MFDTFSIQKGVYVLQDNKFKLLTQMSSGKQYMESAPRVSFDFLHSKKSLETTIFLQVISTMQ